MTARVGVGAGVRILRFHLANISYVKRFASPVDRAHAGRISEESVDDEKALADGVIRQARRVPPAANDFVQNLVAAARHHAASTCRAIVRSGALIAKTFNDHAPSVGDAVRPYSKAARLLRAEIEQIAATGAADLCDGANAALRTLVGPAVDAAIDSLRPGPSAYTDARTQEELVLHAHARRLMASYLLGDEAPELVATDPRQ